MRIEHVAVWSRDLERLKAFYETYFGARASARYANPGKQFESYFMTFPSGGARLELMRVPNLLDLPGEPAVGCAHLAVSAGSVEAVDALTARLRADGYQVEGGPRYTGDGYYESVVLDPDGNRVEITI
jgi:lactoylglutathione lyase